MDWLCIRTRGENGFRVQESHCSGDVEPPVAALSDILVVAQGLHQTVVDLRVSVGHPHEHRIKAAHFSVLLQAEASLLGTLAPSKVRQAGRNDMEGNTIAALVQGVKDLCHLDVATRPAMAED